MDLNELQSVQSRERQTDSLQQLRATFYQDAAEFIQDLEAERDAAAERADDPWNAPEVGRLNDDIDTAKDTVEAIYERRVGKIVKMASLAAADMPTDDEGLTEEEQDLFDRLVAAIEQNREGVFAILDGDAPPSDPTDAAAPAEAGSPAVGGSNPGETPPGADSTPSADASAFAGSGDDRTETPPAPDGSEPGPSTGETSEPDVGAADLMGSSEPADEGSGTARSGDGPANDATADPASPDPATGGEPTETVETGHPVRDGGSEAVRSDGPAAEPPGDGHGDDVGDSPDGISDGPESSESPDHAVESRQESRDATGGESGSDSPGGAEPNASDPAVDRAMVRITDDVGPIYGVEGREYDLTADDVVTLPEANVGPLLEQGAAERLD